MICTELKSSTREVYFAALRQFEYAFVVLGGNRMKITPLNTPSYLS